MTTAFDKFKTDLDAASTRAVAFVSLRRKDAELYSLLAECMAFCERCDNEGLIDDLKKLVIAERSSGHKKGRVYFFGDTDTANVVGRYMFTGNTANVGNRASWWRYITTIRQAFKQELKSHELVDWLRSNGGINALYRPRVKSGKMLVTKTLYLSEQVSYPSDAEFTLTLRRNEKGFFDVVSNVLPMRRESEAA